MGRGREPWERSEAGGVNDDERHLHHSPVSSPTEELRKDKRRSDNSERWERTRPGLLFVFCIRQSSVRGCRFSFVYVYFIIKVSNVRRFPPPSSRSMNCVTITNHNFYIGTIFPIQRTFCNGKIPWMLKILHGITDTNKEPLFLRVLEVKARSEEIVLI